MAEWLAVIAVMALFWAIVRGFQRGAQSAGHLYREAKTRLTKDAVAGGHGRFARSSGRNAGLAVGATVSGFRVIAAAAWRGLGEGWRDGWNRGQTRRANTVDHDQTATPDSDPVAGRGTTVDAPSTGPARPSTPAGATAGGAGVDTDAGRNAMAMGRCPWNYGPRVCGFPRDPDNTDGSPFCRQHNKEIAAHATTPAAAFVYDQPLCAWRIDQDTARTMAELAAQEQARTNPNPDRVAVLQRLSDKYSRDCPRFAGESSPFCGYHEFNEPIPPSNPEEGVPMSTPTATTGNVEVRTIRQLCEALKEIATNARAELDEAKAEQGRAATDMEDAAAAKQRADAESQRMESAQAHLGSMNLDAASLGEIAAVHVACVDEVTSSATRLAAADMRLAAAKKRVAGAELRASAADTAATNIWARHGRHQQSAEEGPVPVADGGAYNPV